MVAKITIPKRLIAVLNYNGKKVSQEKAECLCAGNFLKDAKDLNFYEKLERFQRLNELNDRAKTKTLHASLNFDPSEKLSNEKLIAIASDYINKIGFADQPFLVYKHYDAGHPHIHIVSTTIREDGSRINTHNIGRNQSDQARKEIEIKYRLIHAELQRPILKQPTLPIDPEKIIYGKAETKSSISRVVNAVVKSYKYSSLAEFNAILKQYNILADRGSEDGRIFKNRGLMYRVLDASGNKVGVPIKASSISSKPTLKELERLFSLNESRKQPFKDRVKSVINSALAEAPVTWKDLTRLLEQKHIVTVFRENQAGRIYGITFIDSLNKVVFNGSDLGKGYSASALETKIPAPEKKKSVIDLSTPDQTSGKLKQNLQMKLNFDLNKEFSQNHSSKTKNLLEHIMTPKAQSENLPFQLLKKKKRKPKNNLGL